MLNKEKTKPNILFLLIDSLRADKAYGDQRSSKTPNLDKMIKTGTYFTQAISPSDASGLSLRSIFTGLLPFKTGNVKNRKIENEKINNNFPTITNVLKNSGYTIFGKVPSLSFLDSLYSEFEDDDKFSVEKQWPRLDDGIGEAIIKKLKTNLENPWFYYIHLLDVHSKITPGMAPMVIPQKFDTEQFGKSKYERAVSATDWWLGEILKNVNLDETIVIITADHGSLIPHYQKDIKISFEETITPRLPNIKTPKFLNPLKSKVYSKIMNNKQKSMRDKLKKVSLTEYEKRNLFASENEEIFKVLYDDMVRVPLLFVGKNIPRDKILNHQVSLRDILPTIIDILQLDENISVDGRSLCPSMEEKSIKEEPIFIQSSFPLDKESGYLMGIRTPKYKYNRSIDDPKENVFLYDLQKDPQENHNIAKQHSDIVKEMEQIISKMTNYRQEKQEPSVDEDIKKKIEEEYKKLGYL